MDFMNIFTPLHSSFELSLLQLKSLLASTITSKLPTFTYNGAYIWYSPWEDHCRRVIQVYPLKGASAVFRWGLCFDFLPIFGESGSLRYQRTDRNSQYNWPSPDYVTAFLSAANGDTQTGVKILDEFWLQQCQGLPDDLHNKLREKLLACANLKV